MWGIFCVSEFVPMPPARPFWKGYLKLSLVSCPIALFPASSSSERVSFRQINKKTGHRLKQQLVDSVTGELVESQDKGRGYAVGARPETASMRYVASEPISGLRHRIKVASVHPLLNYQHYA